MLKQYYLPIVLLLGLSVPITSLARDPTAEEMLSMSLEELGNLTVSIATGTPKSLRTAPAIASVITAHDLAQTGAQDIGEALASIPGVYVSRAGLTYTPRYFIRGIASQDNTQTLVLVNGVPQTSLKLGDRGEAIPTIYSLPVSFIDRIEIIRGPGSALYGADAFAGVINLITKPAESVQGGEASMSIGSFASYRASLLQAGQWGNHTKAVLALNYQRTQGDDPMISADAQSQLDARLKTNASLAPGSVSLGSEMVTAYTEWLMGDVRLRLRGMRAWNIGTSHGPAEALDPQGHYTNEHASANVQWLMPNAPTGWQIESLVSYLYKAEHTNSLRLFPPGANLGRGVFNEGALSRTSVAQAHARADINARYQGWTGHHVALGAGFFWGDLFRTTHARNNDSTQTPLPDLVDISDTPAVYQPENQRTNRYVWLQDEWALSPQWELTTGLRYDRFSDFGDTTNPRLALVWQNDATLSAKLMYGEAFRAPSFFELYAKSSKVSQGNPALMPEKLKNLELAMNWTPRDPIAWDVNVYAFRIRDFIDFVSDVGQPTFTAQNIGRINGHGVETELRYQPRKNWQVLANYSYQQTKDKATAQPLGIAPNQHAHLRTTWDWATRWQLSSQLTWVGERQRTRGDPRDELAGYTTLDMTLRQQNKHYDLSVTGRNLANVDVREPSRGPGPGKTQAAIPDDLPQPRRSVTLAATIRW